MDESRRPGNPRLAILALALVAAGLAGAGPGPPDVVRLRVPASTVADLLPRDRPRAELTLEAFERLLAQARGASQRRDRPEPVLVRARHAARWHEGSLHGESDLVLEQPTGLPGWVTLSPWGLPLKPDDPSRQRWRSSADGSLALRVGPQLEPSVRLSWQLAAVPGTEGRSFWPRLPLCDETSVLLDLPSDLVPEVPAGFRREKVAGMAPGRQAWRFDGRWGDRPLRLAPVRAGTTPSPSIPPTIGGTTTVKVEGGVAQWRIDWDIQSAVRLPGTLTIDLDGPLEVIEVAGPAVLGHETTPRTDGRRVEVRLAMSGSPSTRVSVRAVAPVPLAGTWVVPSARPSEAVWVGGTTTVRLDRSRAIDAIRDRAGRHVASRTEPVPGQLVLSFESVEPGPVAEIEWRAGEGRPAASVLGRVEIGPDAPRLSAIATWARRRPGGGPLDLAFDLAPEWVVDRVEEAQSATSVSWRSDDPVGGVVRYRILPNVIQGASQQVALRILARRVTSAAEGRFALPRIRPVGTEVSDERWALAADPGFEVRPVSDDGLSWVDPSLVPSPTAGNEPASTSSQSLLAWRWIEAEGAAAVEVRPTPRAGRAEVRIRADIDPDRSEVEAEIDIEPGPSETSFVIVAAGAGDVEPTWRRHDGASSSTLTPDRLSSQEIEALGLPDGSVGWRFERRLGRDRRLRIRGTWSGLWSGSGSIPLPVVASGTPTSGMLVLRTRDVLVSEWTLDRARAIDPAVSPLPDPEWASRAIPATGSESSSARVLAVHYDRPGASARLRTIRPSGSGAGMVVVSANLLSVLDPEGPTSHVLALRVMSRRPDLLLLRMPAGASLEGVDLDGAAIVPVANSGRLAIPLSPGSPEGTPRALILRYRSPNGPRPGERMRVDLPEVDAPCLDFSWELAMPGGWEVAEVRGLESADPEEKGWSEPDVTHVVARLRRVVRGLGWGRVPEPLDRDRVRALLIENDVPLGEQLLRLDGQDAPIVVDRIALASVGVGPGTRLASSGALGPLETAGLELVARDGLLVLTTRDAVDELGQDDGELGVVEDGGRSPSSRLRAAAATGADRSDRFQSVARWRGESTPRPGTRPGWSDDPLVRQRGWRLRRFVRAGWPSPESSVRIRDGRRDLGMETLALAGALLLGWLGRNLRPAGWGVAVALACATAVVLVAAGDVTRPAGVGLLRGISLVALVALGGALGVRPPAGMDPPSRDSRRRVELVRGVGLAVALGTALVGGRSFAGGDPTRSILVLLPFEGKPPMESRPTDRVVLSAGDLESLRSMAGRAEEVPATVVRCLDASHRWTKGDDGWIRVESEYLLDPDGPGPATWTWPLGPSRDVTATLDDAPAPVRILDSGRNAEVRVDGGAVRRLRVRSTVPLRPGPDGGTMELPLAPVASARVAVRGPGTTGPGFTLFTPRGPVQARGEAVEAILGPVDRVRAVWDRPAATTPAPVRSAAESQMLWDAQDAGDRLRVRWEFRDLSPSTMLRFELEPQLVPVAVDVAGAEELVEIREGSPRVLLVRVDRELVGTVAIALELWRPRLPQGEEGRASSVRRVPRIVPLDIGTRTGLIALRRPGDWTGRLVGGEGIPDEAFVRAWGELPTDTLTLAGAARVVDRSDVEATLAPETTRWSSASTLRVGIEPGRVSWDLEAELRPITGRVFSAELALPPGLRLTTVEGDGLSDWSRPRPERLRLRFDGGLPDASRVRVSGWLPSDPGRRASLAGGTKEVGLDLPLPEWVGGEVASSRLALSGPPTLRLQDDLGLLPESPRGPGARWFRLDGSAARARLLWSWPPPEADVDVVSHLTLFPGSAVWVATIDYEFADGPVESLFLNLPPEWAAASTLLQAPAHRLEVETRSGVVAWAVRLDRPIWGRCRLVIRGERPWPSETALAFPDLVPRGRGAVATFLGVTNATPLPLLVRSERNLTPADLATFASAWLPARSVPTTLGYKVSGEDWDLTLELGRGGRPGGPEAGSATTPARVALAEAEVTLDPAGTALGLMRLEVLPGSGSHVDLRVPTAAIPLLAWVDRVPSNVYEVGRELWRIPLGREPASELRIIWRSSRPQLADDSLPITIPGLLDADVPMSLAIHGPEDRRLGFRGRGVVPLTAVESELDRATAWVESLAARFRTLDVEEPTERERLRDALVAAELRLRTASRAVSLSGGTWKDAALEQRSIAPIRNALERAVGELGSEELYRSVRGWLGIDTGQVSRSAFDDGRDGIGRVRRVGTPWYFRARSTGGGVSPGILDVAAAPRRDLPTGFGWSLAWASVIAGGTALLGRRLRAWAVVLVALLASVVMLGIGVPGPWIGLGWGALLWGWAATRT